MPSPDPKPERPSWSSTPPAEKYRTLFDSIDEGFCVIEVCFDDAGQPEDYVFVEANPSFERQTGLAGAVGRRMRELAPGHEAHWFRIYGEVARTGRSVRFEERAEALGRWYDVYAFRVGAEDEHLVAVLFNDITARKGQEAALADAARRKDEFIAILAHELRNPLAPLRHGLQAMALSANRPEMVERVRQMMERQVDHLVSLVQDLLDVSRLSRGLVALDRQPTDLVDLVHRALEAAEGAIREKGHELALQLPPSRVPVDVDRVRMVQVLTNLLLNAAKYTPPGGRLSLSLKVDGSEAVVGVADNGIGISPDMLERVFDRFTQVEKSSMHSQGGLGIGLSLVRQLLAMHDGTVQADSAGLGRGSTFTVRLPLSSAVRIEAQPAASPMGAASSPKRVLVADDNADAAESLKMMLQLLGHEVQAVDDGEQALAAARQFRPHVVILDIGMPRLDGLSAARQLRAMPNGADFTLVALTGWGQPQDRHESAAAGFDHHFVKPVSIEALAQVLE
jgi:PAS domain S-box-containing protein